MTCTVLAIYILGVMSIVFGEPVTDAASSRSATQKQIAKIMMLLLCFGSAAVALDKSLQRQIEHVLINIGFMQAEE